MGAPSLGAGPGAEGAADMAEERRAAHLCVADRLAVVATVGSEVATMTGQRRVSKQREAKSQLGGTRPPLGGGQPPARVECSV